MKKLCSRILIYIARRSLFRLPVVIDYPKWDTQDEAWLRHVLEQSSGKKLWALLSFAPMSAALNGDEKSPFEQGKVAGASSVLSQIYCLCGSPHLDEESPTEESKTL